MGINPVPTRPRSPSSSPTTFCPPTAPVPSWPCPPDTRDWEFARSSACPSLKWSGHYPVNLDEAAFTDVATGTPGQLRLPEQAVRHRCKEKDDHLAGRDRQGAVIRSTTSCATGCSAVSVTGASPSPWCTATSAAGSLCPSSLPLTLPDITDFEPGRTEESPLARHKGLGQDHLSPAAAAPLPVRLTPCPSKGRFFLVLPALHGPHCKDALASGSTGILVSGGLVQRRHGAHHHPCICCTAASGISSCY